MSSGIYAYWDNIKNYYVYVGKDNNIDKKSRHYKHIAPYAYDKQKINMVLQNNSERYEYRVIMEGDYDDWQLNQMEKLCIKSFKTFKEDYPERSVFNFTKGGDGQSGFKHSKKTRKKMSEAHSGKKHQNSKYTIWDIKAVHYHKQAMFKNNGGDRPKKVFQIKLKGENIPIGGFIDFTTPEIIHDLICEAVEDYKG